MGTYACEDLVGVESILSYDVDLSSAITRRAIWPATEFTTLNTSCRAAREEKFEEEENLSKAAALEREELSDTSRGRNSMQLWRRLAKG